MFGRSNKPKNGFDWESIINVINDAITVHDTDFKIIKCNKAAEQLLGKDKKLIFKNKCFVSYHGTEKAPEGCPSCNVLKTGEPCIAEAYEPHLGKFVEIKALPRFDENNKLIGLVHIVRDITERKKAEKDIASLAKFPSENPNPVMRLDNDKKVIYKNNAAKIFQECWDEKGEECINDMLCSQIGKAIKEQSKKSLEITLKGKTYATTLMPVPEEKYINLYALDITSRKKAEHDTIKEKENAERFLNIAGVMILGINPKKEVIVMNKKGAEILGYPIEEIIGKNFFTNFLPKRIQEEILEVSDKLFAGDIDPVEYYENPIINSKGEERLIAWHNSVLRNEQGDIIAHLSSGEDITERKKAENALKERIRELEILHKTTVDRELHMIKLKEEIKKLQARIRAKDNTGK